RPLPERRKHLRFRKKTGTPAGIRTRNIMFLRHARIPIPPAGQTKSPGTLRRTRAREEGGRNSSLAVSFGPEGARGRIAERARVRLLLSTCPWLQSRVRHFNPRRCCRSYANAALRLALTSKQKSPERFRICINFSTRRARIVPMPMADVKHVDERQLP